MAKYWVLVAGQPPYTIDASQLSQVPPGATTMPQDQEAVDLNGGSQLAVDPQIAQTRWAIQEQRAWTELQNQQNQTGINAYNAQTNAAQANASALGTAGNLYLALNRDPANYGQYSALMHGDPRGGISPAMAAMSGLTGGGLWYTPMRQDSLKPQSWKNAGMDKLVADMFGGGQAAGGGGGGGGPSVSVNGQPVMGDPNAVDRGMAGTGAGVPMLAGANDPNMLQVGTANGTGPGVRNELGLGGGVGGNYTTAVPRVASGTKSVSRNGYASRDDRVGYYEDIGSPNRALISYGIDPLDESGNLIRPMWIDGQLVSPDGWDHEAWRYPGRNPINQAEEYEWGKYVQSDFDPALYPSWALAEEQDAPEWQQRRVTGAAESAQAGQGVAAAPGTAQVAPNDPNSPTAPLQRNPGEPLEAYQARLRAHQATLTGDMPPTPTAPAASAAPKTEAYIDEQGVVRTRPIGATTTTQAMTNPTVPTVPRGGGRVATVGQQPSAQPTPTAKPVWNPSTLPVTTPNPALQQDPTKPTGDPFFDAPRTRPDYSGAAAAAAADPNTPRPGETEEERRRRLGQSTSSSGGRVGGPGFSGSKSYGVGSGNKPPPGYRAFGGLDPVSVVTDPTLYTHGGRQFVNGEGSADELRLLTPSEAVVYPLQNPAVAVPAQAAQLANALVPGAPYAPSAGPLQQWQQDAMAETPAYAANWAVPMAAGGMAAVPLTPAMPAASMLPEGSTPIEGQPGLCLAPDGSVWQMNPDGTATMLSAPGAGGEPPVMMASGGIEPVGDTWLQRAMPDLWSRIAASSPTFMKKGGITPVVPEPVYDAPELTNVGGTNVLAGDAKLWSSNRPFELNKQPLAVQEQYNVKKPKLFNFAKDKNWNGLMPETRWISESGQIQAPNRKGGGWKTIPQHEGMPLADPSEMLTTVADEIQSDPLLLDLITSQLSARGRAPASFWGQANSMRVPQMAPSSLGMRRVM